MVGDLRTPSEPLRAFDAQVEGDKLVITVRKEFDSGNIHQDWAQTVQVMHPGPFTAVIFDLSRCGLVSSTFFAGLLQLHQFYETRGVPPLVIRHPDPRVAKNLRALRFDRLFTIQMPPT